MRLHQNTFTGGLDTDSSVNKYDNTKMFRSENFRLLSGDGPNKSQTISSIEYNKPVIKVDFPPFGLLATKINGLAEGDSSLFILATDSENFTYVIEIPLEDIDPDNELSVSTGSSQYVKLWKDFGYTSDTKVKIIVRKETSKVKKIYFTDKESEIFHVNLEDPDIQNYDINKFRVLPHSEFSPITDVELVSGNLKTGKVQYAYQYYNLNGAETVFSPVGSFINLSTSSQSSQVREYQGSDIGETTLSGVKFTISNLSRDFDNIRLVRILYEEFKAEPSIQVFQEAKIPSEGDLVITDRGVQILEQMVSEEFVELLLDAIPKTWETKNQYLFIGNTTEKPFRLDYDARAVRYNQDGQPYAHHNLKNPYNILSHDGDSNYEYKYHPDRKGPDGEPLLGGKGENVEYWFRTKKILIDQGEDLGKPYIKKLSAQDGSYANWENAAKYVGYSRDEIYRFGLVGYNKKGQASFVNWIDDIRMPDFKDGTEQIGEWEEVEVKPAKFAETTIRLEYEYLTSIPDYGEKIIFRRDATSLDAIYYLSFQIEGADYNYEFVLQGNTNMGEALQVAAAAFNDNPPHPSLSITARTTQSQNTAEIIISSDVEIENLSDYQDTINGVFYTVSIDFEDEYTNNISFWLKFAVKPGISKYFSGGFYTDSVADLQQPDLDQLRTNYNQTGGLFGTLKMTAANLSTKYLSESVEVKQIYLTFRNTDSTDNFIIDDYDLGDFYNYTHPTTNQTLKDPTYYQLYYIFYEPPETETQFIEEETADYNMLSGEWNGEVGSVYANILYPVFKVDTSKFHPDIVSYQIVRVERDRENRTVIDLGLASNLDYSDIVNKKTFRSVPGIRDGNSHSPNILEYNSVEHLVNNLEGVQGNRLDFLYHNTISNQIVCYAFRVSTDNERRLHYRGITLTPTSENLSNVGKKVIEDSSNHINSSDYKQTTFLKQESVLNLIEYPSITLYGYWHFDDLIITETNEGHATQGSTKLLYLQGDNSDLYTNNDCRGYITRRRNTTYPYGGISKSSLANSVYISAATSNRDNKITEVFEGDVYIGYFNYLKGVWTDSAVPVADDDDSQYSKYKRVGVYNFPVETTINLELLVNPDLNSFEILPWSMFPGPYSSMSPEDLPPYLAMREESGANILMEGTIYEQDFNLYTYNSVYSQPNSLQRFFPEPKHFQDVVYWPNRIYYSDKKTLGEVADSWLKFRPGNFADLDTRYGAIKALVSFKDNLFCFQEKGISILGVEQRELTQTDSPGPLVIGTGEILTQPHYISTHAGISDPKHVTQSRNVIYFYDSLNKKIGRIIEEGIEFLSDSKSIKFLMNEEWSKVYVSYNPHHNEVLFSYNEGNPDVRSEKSLIFNEYLDTFSGVFTHAHSDSVLGNHKYFTINRNVAPNRIFQDSVKSSDTIYNETPDESLITLIINPLGNIISVFDILELTLEVYNSQGELLPNKCLSAIRCYNEWQDTGRIELTDENIIQRFRTWRMNSMPEYTEDEARLRSSSLFVDLYFSNSNNEKLVLHDLITKYRSNIPYQQEDS